MRRFRIGAEVALTPADDLLDGVSVSPLTSPIGSGAPVQVAIFRIRANGGIRQHPATVPQILAVLSGSGEVAGLDGEGFLPVTEGDAVYWSEGEPHETRTEDGMTVLIVEGPGIVPFGLAT